MGRAASGAGTPSVTNVPSWAAASLESARVLIVDDREANVRLLRAMLSSAGVPEIEGLTDARRTVERVLDFRPDVLLLDLHMPTMDGVSVLHALREALPADAFLPVVVLTADVTAGARERALAAGAKDFLTKPIDRLEVLLRVSNLLETRALYLRVHSDRAQLQHELEQQRLRERLLDEKRRGRMARIDGALLDGGMHVEFQPIVELESGRVVGVEALSRFAGPPHRPPDQWFAEAATIGRGVELELLAIERALTHLGSLRDELFVSLNVSPTTARSVALDDRLADVPLDRIVLELTEHTKIRDYHVLRVSLDRFRERGCRIAVDDAGAGYAGLQHILSLQPDVIKLDHGLTRSVDSDPARRALSTCLVRFADEIGAYVVAEGIETAAELETLHALGIRWGQGFHLGRPAPVTSSGVHNVVVNG